MTARHRSTFPPSAGPPRRAARAVRAMGGVGRQGFGHAGVVRMRGPGNAEGRLPASTAANDNRPTLRWRLARLVASLGVLTICGAIVMLFDS